MFRLNDNISVNNIIRNHNTDNVDKDTFKKLYLDATSEPLNFFMLDLRGKPETRLGKISLSFIGFNLIDGLKLLHSSLDHH